MIWVCWGMILLVMYSPSGQCYRRSSSWDSDDGVSRKIEKLGDQVSTITNELKRLKDQVKTLKDQSGSESKPREKVLPLEVKRQILSGGRAKFTVKYWVSEKIASVSEPMANWMNAVTFQPIKELISNEIPMWSRQEHTSSIITEASNETGVMVSIGVNEFWYRIFIKNALDGMVNQKITSLPILQVTPSGDIVYKPGTNATFQVTAPLEQKPEDPSSYIPDNLEITYTLNPPGSDVVLDNFQRTEEMDRLFGKPKEKLFWDEREVSININTSGMAYSGLLQLTAGQSYPQDMVYRIEKNIQKVLRPSTQTGPFRDGLLATKSLYWIERTGDDVYKDKCELNEVCHMFCEYFGTDLNPITLLKTVDDKTETIYSNKRITGKYVSSVWYTFSMTRGGDNPINFTCIASDKKGLRKKTTIIYHLRDLPVFVEDQSSVEMTSDNKLNFTCTAVGVPLPTMNITINDATHNVYNEDDLDILYQTEDTISVSKVVSVVRDTDHDFISGICEATNTGGTSSHYIMYPNIFGRSMP